MHIPRSRLFWAVSLGHMTNDMFISMTAVLLTFISANVMPVSAVQIGLILSVATLLGAITQPLFGWLADRGSGRLLGAGGVAWTVILMMVAVAAAEASIFWLMALAFVLPALGSGAFHPVGAMYAGRSDEARAASNLAYFFLLGQLGLGLGPALAGLVLNGAVGTERIFIDVLGPAFTGLLRADGHVAPLLPLIVLAIPGIALMAFAIPAGRVERAAARATHEASVGVAAPRPVAARPMVALVLRVTGVGLRSLAQPGSVNFIPVLFEAKGWTPAEYGLITSSFWVASGLAGVAFGNLADRFDRRWVVAGSLLASAPAFFLLPLADGALAFALAMLAGGLSGGSHSIIVVYAQSLLPGKQGLASGLIMGLIFGMGAVGNFLIGLMSDTIGLDMAFYLVSGAIVIAAALSLALPSSRRAQILPVTPPEPVIQTR